ncbi:MAG: hypothetical protein WD802_10850 [Gemmatimonadaceae bacterium]
MKTILGTLITLTMLANVACAPARETIGEQVNATTMIAGWPETPRMVAKEMIEKYGPPDETTASMLIWHDNGPWKRTIVYREEVPHAFPKQHTDLLEQFVDYRVRPALFDELAEYDGSVIVERTKGEMSARCDKEAMNFLALNLANDIVAGRRTVADARRVYAETAKAFMTGNQTSAYVTGLQFRPMSGAADPDTPAPGMM